MSMQVKKSNESSDLMMRFEDFFEFSVNRDGKRTCSMNLEAMSLLIGECTDYKIIVQVIEDVMKMNQILSGQGKIWVKKANSERDLVYLV